MTGRRRPVQGGAVGQDLAQGLAASSVRYLPSARAAAKPRLLLQPCLELRFRCFGVAMDDRGTPAVERHPQVVRHPFGYSRRDRELTTC